MELRETTSEDLIYAANNSVSRVDKEPPEQTDFMYTIEHEGDVLAVGGFRLINHTTAWCHVNLTNKASSHTIHTYRIIRDWINEFVEEHGIKRLQAYVEADFQEGIDLVKHLGFERESIMPNFV